MDFVRKFTSLSSREKNENILRNDKVMGMSLDCLVYYFLGDSVFARVIVGPLCWVCNECYFMLLFVYDDVFKLRDAYAYLRLDYICWGKMYVRLSHAGIVSCLT